MGSNQPVAKVEMARDNLVQSTLTLTSLAILKVDIDERHRDYIGYLATFVLSVLETRRPEIVTDVVIAGLLAEEFGLRIPVKAVQHVLRRLARDGHLRKEHEAFFPAATLPRVDIGPKRQEAAERIQRVYDALCRFASAIQPTAVNWTNADAATAILGFLGRFAVDCLKTYVFKTTLPQVPNTGPRELYIVSCFVQHVYEKDPTLFEDFIVLIKGQMYANALTCPDLQSLEQKFDRVSFYLDTPVVLNLLGLQGRDAQQAAEELITLVRDLRGSLSVFEHTYEEIKGAIKYAAQRINDPQVTTRILREVRNSGVTLSDLLLCLDQLREKLSVHYINLRKTPPYQATFQIDESAFQDVLEDEILYHGDQALLNDVNSVRSIYVLRRVAEPARLEDAGAIFVTTNSAFARAAYEFGKTHNSSKEVSSVITDYSLANVAWLKAPMKRPSLPEKETLALCYAALEPGKGLFRKYVEVMSQLTASGLISEEDHAILRLSPIAHQELMHLTLGDEEALTNVGLRQILERAKNRLVAEQKEIAADERKKIEEQHATVLHAQQEKERSLTTALDHEKDMYRSSSQEHTDVLLAASGRARSVSKVVTILIMLAFSAVLLVGAAAGAGLLSPQKLVSTFGKILIWASVIVAVGWGWLSWITGKTVRGLVQVIEHRVTLKLFSWFTGRRSLP